MWGDRAAAVGTARPDMSASSAGVAFDDDGEDVALSAAAAAAADADAQAAAAVATALSLAHMLALPQTTAATALYYLHSFQRFKAEQAAKQLAPPLGDALMVSACIYLACKQTEMSRRLRDILNVGYWYYNHGSDGFLDTENSLYWELKESLINAELLLVRILHFDTNVELVYPHLVMVLEDFWVWHEHAEKNKSIGGQYALAEFAWTVANEVYVDARICLDFHPKVLAVCCTVLALRGLGYSFPTDEWINRWDDPSDKAFREALDVFSAHLCAVSKDGSAGNERGRKDSLPRLVISSSGPASSRHSSHHAHG
ncbi:cyclin-like protein [Zopfochytrium polystomum]|nr:cyclin-like protein [Zopfochytrium polystomum]